MALGTCQPKAAMWSRLVTQVVGVQWGGLRGTGNSRGPREADPPPRHTEPWGAPPRARCPHPTQGAHNPESKPEAGGGHRQEPIQGNGVSEGSGSGQMAEAPRPTVCTRLAGRSSISRAPGARPKGLVADRRTVRGRQEGRSVLQPLNISQLPASAASSSGKFA